MIELRENAIAIVHNKGEYESVMEISNWGGKYVTTISIKTYSGKQTMGFDVDEFIALAEILKQLKQHRK